MLEHNRTKGIKMCKKTRKLINALPAIDGPMNSGSKEGMLALLNEVEALTRKQDSFSEKQEEFDKRLETIETATAETLKIAAELYKKLDVNKIEEKAAQLDLLTKFASSKLGKTLLIIGLVSLLGCGLATAYLIEHSHEVSQLADSVKKVENK